jgi:hypothetical protein
VKCEIEIDAACVALWLGWAYLTKTVRKPQRGGVSFEL